MKSRFLFVSRPISFFKRQERDWKVTVARTSIDRLDHQIVLPYLSIYIVALGATATQLGLVNSLGMVVAGLFGPPTGWLIDRIGPRRIYLLGISLLAVSYLTYGLAQTWTTTIAAMIAYWLGFSVSVHSCATICGNCLANEDRATGMSICETVAAGLLGMAGPMLGAWVVTTSGGVNVGGIRPLFFLGLAGTIGSFFIVLTQLSSSKWGMAMPARPNPLKDINQVFREGHHLKRWLIIASVGQLPLGMVLPFSPVFAHEIKGADQYVLGAMVTASALASIAFAMPLGRLADRLGRKRVLYFTIPVFWASALVLVWAPSPAFLIVAGLLQGFYYIGAPISAAIERELVPPDRMGRWIGIARFFKMLTSACLVFASGIIWDKLGPQYVFLIFIGLDLAVRMPLLLSMPETLTLRLGRQGQPPTR